MHHHAAAERHELATTLRAREPSARTLCTGWTVAHLAAHLVLRERSFADAAGRLPVPRLRARAERRLAEYVARVPYQQTVALVDDGPRLSEFRSSPLVALWAIGPLNEVVNLLEYVVHHEDIRRAGESWQPRLLPVARQRAVWSRLRLAAPVTMRSVPVGVELVWPAHGAITTRRGRRGHSLVTVTGDPVELALVAFGRQRAAQVDYDGKADDVATLSTARIAI